jgi:hypothetical protein
MPIARNLLERVPEQFYAAEPRYRSTGAGLLNPCAGPLNNAAGRLLPAAGRLNWVAGLMNPDPNQQ